MTRLILGLLLASPAWCTWTLRQSASFNSCTGTTCTISGILSTVSGNILVVGTAYDVNANSTISSLSAGGTWTIPSGCHIFDATNNLGVDCAYTLSATGGVSSIDVVRSATVSAWQVNFREYSTNGGVGSAQDAVGTIDNTVSSSTPSGVALTLCGTTDFIYQGLISIQGVSAVASPYGNLDVSSGLSGWADDLNTSTGTAPSWTLFASGTSVGFGLAIKEGGACAAGGTPPGTKRKKQIKLGEVF